MKYWEIGSRRNREIVAKYKMIFPASAEREYARVANSYMNILNKAVIDSLVPLLGDVGIEYNTDSRMDGFVDKVSKKMSEIGASVLTKAKKLGMAAILKKMASMVRKSSFREWKKVISKTLGIDLNDKHYDDAFYQEIIQKWFEENIELMNENIERTLNRVKECILLGKSNGKSPADIAREVKKILDSEKEHAKRINKDQISKLNTAFEKKYCQDAGADRYMWITKKDERVRECHRTLHGKIFFWSDPPEMWYRLKNGAIVVSGRRCHPGEDYNCRCIALPIFNLDKINLQISRME